jgi:hypothetical protein
MQTRPAWLLALTVVGCGQFRNAPPPPPITLAPPPPPVVRAARPARPRHLACIQHPRIDVWEHRLRSHHSLRAGTRGTLVRARPYLPRVRRIFSKAGLPPSLALLPVIESDFYRTAQGRLDDRGLWQFRVATAQRFGLVVNERRDQRLHPYRASRAAARYLRILYRRYGDWPLALAAYNAGENRVARARARRPGASFWQLAEQGHLPRTTVEYVPRFLALIRVVDGKAACAAPADDTPAVTLTRAKPSPRPAPVVTVTKPTAPATTAAAAPAPVRVPRAEKPAPRDGSRVACDGFPAPRGSIASAQTGRVADL